MDVGLVSVCFGQGNMSESNSRPARVEGGSGKLVLPAEGSIVVAPADEAALKSVATVLAQDLKDLLIGTIPLDRETERMIFIFH